MTNPTTASFPETSSQIAELLSQLRGSAEKKQLQLISEVVDTSPVGLEVLMEFLKEQPLSSPSLSAGLAYQTLYQANTPTTQEFLQTHFPTGIVPLRSEMGIDYGELQQKLAQQDFLLADTLTLEKLCQLGGATAAGRKWLYFSEVEKFPITDLQTINTLWLVHSLGKFGFSVQREIWLSLGKNWDKFWPKIGWKTGSNWTRYPKEFIWALSAPKGHLPLSNQLRGVRVFSSLLSHPAWLVKGE